MILYNVQMNENPFSLGDISHTRSISRNIRSTTFGGRTSFTNVKKCTKKRLTKKNVKFLQSIGFKVKGH